MPETFDDYATTFREHARDRLLVVSRWFLMYTDPTASRTPYGNEAERSKVKAIIYKWR